jgi:hypothetical protein
LCAEGHDWVIVRNNPVNYYDPLGLYTSARWLRKPSLSGISSKKVGDIGFGEYWTLLPPAIGIGGEWWMLTTHIAGVVECKDDECNGNKRDVFNVKVDLSKRIGIGWGITTYPIFQFGRKAGQAFSSILDAIEFYRNDWTQLALKMANEPMTWCLIMSVATPGK